MFHGWHRGRDGTLAHTRVAHSRRPIRRAIERWLAAGHTGGVPKTAGTCRDLLTRRHAWWTYGRHAGVDPTHHAAERALRPGVLWRRGSLGTHSPEGSRLVEVMMTVVATLKQPHRNVLDSRTATCEAAWCGEAPTSLRPTPAAIGQLICPAV